MLQVWEQAGVYTLGLWANLCFCLCSTEVTGEVIDKDVFAILCKHLQNEAQATAAELQVLKAYLTLCHKDAKSRCLFFQLRDGPRRRSIKSFLVDWQERKQVRLGPGLEHCCMLTGLL